MADNPLETLRSAGVNVDGLPENVRQTLSGLSAEEARTLADVARRVKGSGGGGAGMAADSSGYVIY